jgi:hypothetical protein
VSSIINFQPRLVDFNEIQQGGPGFEGDIDAMIFNPIVSAMAEVQTSEMDAKHTPVRLGLSRKPLL